MGDNSTLNIVIFVSLCGVVCFFLIFYLKYLIAKSNSSLVTSLVDSLHNINDSNIQKFDSFIYELNKNYEGHLLVIKKFTEHLQKETDRYSESVSKYRNSINEINDKSVQLLELNKAFSKELREFSFKDLQTVTTTLRNTQDSFNKIEASFNKHSQSVLEMLKGFSNFQKNVQNSEANIQSLLTLNNNIEQINKGFRETLVQIQIVSNSVSILSEGKLKSLLENITSVLPEIRNEITKYTTDIYGKFSDSLDTLEDVSVNLKVLTKKYDEIISGNKKDPATGAFLQ